MNWFTPFLISCEWWWWRWRWKWRCLQFVHLFPTLFPTFFLELFTIFNLLPTCPNIFPICSTNDQWLSFSFVLSFFLSLKLREGKRQHWVLGGDGSKSYRWWLQWKCRVFPWETQMRKEKNRTSATNVCIHHLWKSAWEVILKYTTVKSHTNATNATMWLCLFLGRSFLQLMQVVPCCCQI